MGTITGQEIVNDARDIMGDEETAKIYSDAKHLLYINAGQKDIVLLKPDSYVTTTAVLLVAGVKQTVPAGGLGLCDILYNMGTGGTTPGVPISEVNRSDLDKAYPGWTAATGSAVTRNFIYDQKNPTVFHVNPPQPAVSPGYVMMAYYDTPADLATLASVITLDDVYATVLMYYDLFRCYQHYAQNSPIAAQRAATYWSLILSMLGIKEQKESAYKPPNNQ